MMFNEAKRRLQASNYQVLPIQGEDLHMIFWPQSGDKTRRTEALTTQQVIELAQTLPSADEVRRPIVDLHKVGVVGRLRKTLMSTDGEGEPTIQIVLEITGRHAVDSVPVDDLRNMLGQMVLLQLNAVQLRFQLEKKADAS